MTHDNVKKNRMYVVYCKYTVTYPTQVTVFNSCRITEKESESILNHKTHRIGTVTVMVSDVITTTFAHRTFLKED